MAKLILRDDGTGKEFDLEKTGSLTIGRSPDCDITIEDTQASRRHCSVVKLQSGYEVNDLGSTNGTLVNSTLVKRQKLKHGDVIRIGAVEIAFDDPSSAGAAGEPAVGYLVYAKGDKKGQKFELSGQRTTIGRKPTNTLVIEDPVSSSYHCEIVRGLNGYTIRDLGSTNGTLVNSEMVTEAQLTHGARIRIGNTRFVFQDPAMAEIDLELAGAEDEDEWGMMRDIDLAAVRKRNPATVVYTLLFLAIVGAGGYFIGFAKPKATQTGPVGPPNNLHPEFSFESDAAALSWRGEPELAVTLGISTQVHGGGKQSLEVHATAPETAAFYATRLPANRVAYRVKGFVVARGAKAGLGILWRGGGGLERWSTARDVTAGPSEVEVVTSSPPWATSALLGVRIEGAGTVYLDDVSVVRESGVEAEEVALNEFKLTINDGRTADLSHYDAPILVNGRLFARDAQGKAMDVPGLRLTAVAQDKEFILVTIDGAGDAASVGLGFEEVSGYLSRGGFRAFTPSQAKTFHPSFPDEGTLVLEDARKLLLGPSGRSFAVLPATEGGRLDAEASVDGKTRTVAFLGPVTEGRFAFRFKVDLRGEAALAANTIANVLSLYDRGRYGEFQAEAAQVVAEYPFISKNTRDDLRAKIDEVNRKYEEGRKTIDRLIEDYVQFRNGGDLDAGAAALAELQAMFQIKPGEGPRGEYVQQAKAEVDRLDLEAREARETRIAEHSFIQATLVDLQQTPPAYCSAAVQLFYVSRFLPNAKMANAAAAEFQKIAAEHPEVQVLEKLGFGK